MSASSWWGSISWQRECSSKRTWKGYTFSPVTVNLCFVVAYIWNNLFFCEIFNYHFNKLFLFTTDDKTVFCDGNFVVKDIWCILKASVILDSRAADLMLYSPPPIYLWRHRVTPSEYASRLISIKKIKNTILKKWLYKWLNNIFLVFKRINGYNEKGNGKNEENNIIDSKKSLLLPVSTILALALQ